MCWQDLPKELQLRDAEIASLSIQNVNALFMRAKELRVYNQFAELFWDAMAKVRSNPSRISIQQCVNFLEEHKRSIGRAYNSAQKKYPNGWLAQYQAFRYNECEYNIRWLVEQYECKRKTKPYLLEVYDV